MVKEIPMLFSTPMVQAIREGRKTQTRRMVNPQPVVKNGLWTYRDPWHEWYNMTDGLFAQNIKTISKWKIGDLIWVRETHFKNGDEWIYLADGTCCGKPKWKPSLHMPKEAARIWLRVTTVNVERLNEISADDAVCEGVTKSMRNSFGYSSEESEESFNFTQSIHTYRLLWESINGSGSWDKNPWVWVISFEVLSTTGKPEKV